MRLILTVAAVIAMTTAVEARGSHGFTLGSGSSSSSHSVRGHVNRWGTYTRPHYQTNPDLSRSNNYGSSGNLNPYSGGTGDGYGHSR